MTSTLLARFIDRVDFRRADRLRAYAIDYTTHGWPIQPLAPFTVAGCACGRDCDTPHVCGTHNHPVGEVTTSPVDAHRIWTEQHGIGLATGAFCDVLDVPAWLGVGLNRQLATSTPTACGPGAGGAIRWQFVITPGAALPTQLADAGAVLHAAGACVPVSPTRTRTGRAGWITHPRVARWKPRLADVALGHALGMVA